MKNEREEAINKFLNSEEINWASVKAEDKRRALGMIRSLENPSKYDWSSGAMVEAEIGAGWQEYEYDDGKRVPQGEAIGIEVPNSNGEWQLLIFDGISFSSEPDPSDKWIEIDEILEEFGVDKDDVPEDVYESMLEGAYGLDAEEIKEVVKDVLELEGVI